jgi:hypothetical protein
MQSNHAQIGKAMATKLLLPSEGRCTVVNYISLYALKHTGCRKCIKFYLLEIYMPTFYDRYATSFARLAVHIVILALSFMQTRNYTRLMVKE